MTMKERLNETTDNKELDIRTVRVRIVGDTPLVTRRYVYDGRKERHNYYQPDKKPTPINEFISGIYWLTDESKYPGAAQAAQTAMSAETMEEFLAACGDGARFGFMAASIKRAAINTAYANGKSPDKMSIRNLFFIEPDDEAEGLLEIKSDPPVMREDVVKYRNGYISKRYRPEFKSWYCDFNLSYNAKRDFPLEDILEMIEAGGHECGICEWRPEHGGSFGTFHVER